MLTMRQYKTDLTKMLEKLPEEKIIELVDFARFLANQYSKTKSAIDKSSLLLQQKALNHIWGDSEEDIYEL